MDINDKFKFMAFLDKARWCGSGIEANYNFANLANKNADGNQKILTHFIGYITDRQTPFEVVFEQLDYIFSQMLHDFCDNGLSVDELLDPDKPTTYFKKKPTNGSKSGDEKPAAYTFVSHKQPAADSQYEDITRELREDDDAIFYATSRFYPTDYNAIRITLEILSDGVGNTKFARSILEFMKWAIGDDPKQAGLERLLYALWLLGYADLGSWAAKKGQKQPWIFDTKNRLAVFEKKIKHLKEFKAEGLESEFYKKNFARNDSSIKNNDRFSSKRLMCFVRDMLKFKPYAEILKGTIGEPAFDSLYLQMPDVLELPGDVWNNNDRFQKCLYNGESPKGKPNIAIRKLYAKLCKKHGKENVRCYPEQFDCTFSFVPKMCKSVNRENCAFCPLNNKLESPRIPDDFCHRIGEKFCPFLLFSCGFKARCKDVIDLCPNREK
ncbi:MAG: hypothetical protein GX945_04940 [Lentisphaerae bacterium]|nr:hypothetical protein [Lentisphaerota bacterium]